MALERGDAEETAGVLRPQGRGIVDDERMGEPRGAVMADRLEEAEGIGIRELAMLLESLPVEPPLDIVESPRVAAVVAGKQPAFGIEFDAEGVSAPLREHLIASALGVIAPDALARRNHRRLVAPRPAHPAGDRAPLGGVEPAIGAPTEVVGDRMGVFDPKSLQGHHGITIGTVVMVGVGIEEKVGGLEHPQSVGRECEARHQAQSLDENAMFLWDPIAIDVFVEGNPVEAPIVVGRGGRNLVIDAPQERIAADHRQPGRLRILDELRHPQPPAGIPFDRQRLADVGLGEDEIDAEAVGDTETAEFVAGGEGAAVVDPAERRLDLWRRLDLGGEKGRRKAGAHFAPPEQP